MVRKEVDIMRKIISKIGDFLDWFSDYKESRRLDRYNKKLSKLLKKRLVIYQSTMWEFILAEMAFDNCNTLKSMIKFLEKDSSH